MSPLALVWWTALALALAALAGMSGLIVARLFRSRAEARWAADRAAVIAAFMAVLQGSEGAEAQIRPFRRRARLLAEALLEFLNLVRGQDRDTLLAGLRGLKIEDVLIGRLGAGSQAGRLASLEALAVFPGLKAAAALRPACRSRDPEIRLAAWRALVEMGAAISVRRLLEDLARSDLHTSSALAELLRNLTARRPAESLAAAVGEDLPPLVRAMLVEGLGGVGDYGMVPGLMDCTRDAHPEVRAAAVRALGRLMHPAAQPALGRALRDLDWQVRGAAAEAAGDAGLSGLAAPLARLLEDPVWWVRFRGAEALARLGAEGRTRLESVAANGTADARRAAALTLAEQAAVR